MASTAAVQQEVFVNRTFEVVGSGIINSAAGTSAATTTATRSHNLGYVPLIVASVNNGTTSIPLPAVMSNSLAASYIQNFATIQCSVNSTTITISTICATGVTLASYPVRYYLLSDTAK